MWKQRLLFLCVAAPLLAVCVTGPNSAIPADGGAEIAGETHYIALTFDDGPCRDTTARLLDGLKARGASATFFLVGRQIPGNEDLVRRMAAEGHQVGNHTWSHVKLQDAAPATIAQEVKKTDALLQVLLGEGTYWLRPPYGLICEAEKKQIPVPMVHWSVDPMDWNLRDAGKVARVVLDRAKPGDIILLHDLCPTSVEAAFQVIDTLQGRGYCFVTVEELLALHGVRPARGELVRSAHEGVCPLS
ncbi:MAG: polysaccharide deacetylase family protein [Oscillibacter sp.]